MISRCSSPMPWMTTWPVLGVALHTERRVFRHQLLQALPSCTSPSLCTTRVEQDALGGCGLTGIDVGHDADVPRPSEGGLSRHGLPAIVREGLVRLGHPVRVFALLDGAATHVRRIHQFVGRLSSIVLPSPPRNRA